MIRIVPKYVEYSRILGIVTLAIRVREISWHMEELLKKIRTNTTLLKKSVRGIKKENFLLKYNQIRQTSHLLGSELKCWMHYLKLIYYHNSTVLYIHLKILRNLYSQIYKLRKEVDNEKRRSRDRQILRLLKHRQKQINKEAGEIYVTDAALIKSLQKFKKKFNKILRGGFSFDLVTFRTDGRISQKIKIEARRIKETELRRRSLMSKFKIEDERKLRAISHILHKEIRLVEKDVLYLRQLMKKLIIKKKNIEQIIKHFAKKLLRMKMDSKIVNKELVILNKPFREVDAIIEHDLQEMFYNALRQLNMSVRKSRAIKRAA